MERRHPIHLPVYILAGGRSERFGSDKARAPVGGRPMILHVARALEPASSRLTVVGKQGDQYSDLGLRTIADRVAGLGPVGGLAAALEDLAASGERWLLLAPCDLVGLRPSWVQALAEHRAGPARAVAFRDRIWYPLPALYCVDLLPDLRALVREGDLALWRLLDRDGTVALPLPAGWQDAVQVNTPEDRARADPLAR